MVKSVNVKKTVEDATYIFNNGFACSESVIYAIRKNFHLDLPDDVIAMSSGFPWDNADVKNGDGCFYANFKPDRGNYTKDGNLITSKVAIYSCTAR